MNVIQDCGTRPRVLRAEKSVSRMMRTLCLLLAACLLVSYPAAATTHRVHLGAAPLFGRLQSRADLVAKYESWRYGPRAIDAETALGLDVQQRLELGRSLSRAKYVILPRHLDAMAYYSDGVHVIWDVEIPALTKGWEVDIRREKVFIPAVCGNIAIVKVVEGVRKAPMMPSQIPNPSPSPTPSSFAAVAPEATAAPQVQFTLAPTPAPKYHRFPWWIVLLGAPFLFHTEHHEINIGPHGMMPLIPSPTPTPMKSCDP